MTKLLTAIHFWINDHEMSMIQKIIVKVSRGPLTLMENDTKGSTGKTHNHDYCCTTKEVWPGHRLIKCRVEIKVFLL